MDHTIVHFEIPADHPERATKFYRELFGWEIQKWSSEGGPEWLEGIYAERMMAGISLLTAR